MAKIQQLEPEVRYQVLEIDRELSAVDWTKEDEEALATLHGHPGHQALMKKIQLQRAYIRTALESQRFESLEAFTATQAWSQALKWLLNQVKSPVPKKEQQYRSPYQLEEDAFNEISKALKVIS
jgi:hypothetical protein